MTTLQTIPLGFQGSLPEYIVFRELNQKGLRDGVDFIFQSSFQGGRLQKGGLVIDFLFISPSDLAFNVQGTFFHLEQGTVVIARDKMARAQLAAEGITLIFLDEEDIMNEPRRTVEDGLRYIDTSEIGRGG